MIIKISGKIMSNLKIVNLIFIFLMYSIITTRASKAEKGSEFIAAPQPCPYCQQQSAESNGLFKY